MFVPRPARLPHRQPQAQVRLTAVGSGAFSAERLPLRVGATTGASSVGAFYRFYCRPPVLSSAGLSQLALPLRFQLPAQLPLGQSLPHGSSTATVAGAVSTPRRVSSAGYGNNQLRLLLLRYGDGGGFSGGFWCRSLTLAAAGFFHGNCAVQPLRRRAERLLLRDRFALRLLQPERPGSLPRLLMPFRRSERPHHQRHWGLRWVTLVAVTTTAALAADAQVTRRGERPGQERRGMPSPLRGFSPWASTSTPEQATVSAAASALSSAVGCRIFGTLRRFRRQQLFRCALRLLTRNGMPLSASEGGADAARYMFLLLAFFLLFVGALDRVNASSAHFHLLVWFSLSVTTTLSAAPVPRRCC